MSSDNDEYWLATNSHASARLNLQHYWNQLSCGYLIHPDIPVDTHANIADIATGTGIWTTSLSTSLPPTVKLDGFDVTDAQFPPKEWLPANVTLNTLNILDPVPEYLLGKYDVVNIRYFALVVKNNNILGPLKNLISMLKPGGYLQWVEVNMQEQNVISARSHISSTATSDFSANGKRALPTLGVSFDWLRGLPRTYEDLGLVRVRQFKPEPIPALRPMSSYLATGGWEEFSHTVLDTRGPHPILGSGQDLRRKIHEARKEFQAGVAIEQLHYVTIGQRPV